MRWEAMPTKRRGRARFSASDLCIWLEKQTYRLVLVPLLVTLLVIAGCGSTSNTGSESEWAEEFAKIVEGFESTAEASRQAIVAAKSPASLETAYLSYATQLRSLSFEITGTEAPDQCVPLKEEMSEYIVELGEITRQFGTQRHLSENQTAKLAREQNNLQLEFGERIEEIEAGGDGCRSS